MPLKTPDNSSAPPSQGKKPNREDKPKREGPRKGSLGGPAQDGSVAKTEKRAFAPFKNLGFPPFFEGRFWLQTIFATEPFKALRHFRPTFLSNLRLALATYPDARVDEEENGVILHPSRPPVA